MQLSQSVKLKQKQSLVMTPQLQQAIKLLQLSNLELSQHLQEQVDENPFLELGESEDSGQPTADSRADNTAPVDATDLTDLKESAALAQDPTEHSDFENRFDQSIVDTPRASTANAPFEGDYDAISNVSSKEGFYPDLFRQLNLAMDNPKQRLIAGHFINVLEPSGWIGVLVQDVADASDCNLDEAEDVLAILQTFEPTGLFARNLEDCLRLQLIELGAMT
jgi:RNA polymerase sigma-54 factor